MQTLSVWRLDTSDAAESALRSLEPADPTRDRARRPRRRRLGRRLPQAEIGLVDGFLARVRARIVPGTSALLLLGAGDLPVRVVADPDAEVCTLSTEQQSALRHAFAADDLG